MKTTTTHPPADFRATVRVTLRDAWIAGRNYVQPRLIGLVSRIERALGVPQQREWFDRVDTASDESFPASDPPSFGSPRAGAARHQA